MVAGEFESGTAGGVNMRVHSNETPRAAVVRLLTEAVKIAATAGDLAAARVAHEALGKLLVEPEPGNAEVIDISSHPSRKEGAR